MYWLPSFDRVQTTLYYNHANNEGNNNKLLLEPNASNTQFFNLEIYNKISPKTWAKMVEVTAAADDDVIASWDSHVLKQYFYNMVEYKSVLIIHMQSSGKCYYYHLAFGAMNAVLSIASV